MPFSKSVAESHAAAARARPSGSCTWLTFAVHVLCVLCAPASPAQAAAAGRLLEVNPPPAPPPAHTVVIAGGRLIDGRGARPLDDAVIVVKGAEIVAAGKRGDIPMPAGAELIDATGLTVLPGFVDTHLHAIHARHDVPRLFLRNGVTAGRDPGQFIERYEPVIRRREGSPRLFLTGPFLDQAPSAYPHNALIVDDGAAAAAAVHRFADAGATAIKVYFRLPADLIRATCAAAKTRGIPVTAHLELVDADVAIEMGIDGLEHVSSVGTAIAEPELARAFQEAVNANNEARHPWRFRLWSALDLESPRVKRMIELMARRGVVLSPTLAYFYGSGPGSRKPTDEHRKGFAIMQKFTALCHRAGVPVVVGSHTMIQLEPAGQAFQREMELLVEAGIPPMDVLVAATRGGAKFLRAEQRLGTLEPGKLADLVLIAGDPLADIRATRNVRRVMLNGRWVEAPE